MASTIRKKEELLESYDIKSWQSLHVKQLSYVRNLIIILSTALTSFLVSIMLSDVGMTKTVKILLKIAGISYLIPITIGIYLAINVSKNFRLKYEISRIVRRLEAPSENSEFKKKESECTRIEKNNQTLFKVQLLSFLLAFTILLVSLLLI